MDEKLFEQLSKKFKVIGHKCLEISDNISKVFQTLKEKLAEAKNKKISITEIITELFEAIFD